MAQRVLILAGDTDGNLGDLAIVAATCDYLREIEGSVRITIVSGRPQRDRSQLRVNTIPRGWRGILPLVRAAASADLVICGGGGLFQDDDSLVKMPYWACRLALVRMANRRIVGLGIGAGPLKYRVSRLFARMALAMMSRVTVRDAGARDVLQPLTSRRIDIVPDPAFLLRATPDGAARRMLTDHNVPVGKKPLIGVAIRRWFHMDSNLVPHKLVHKIGIGRNRGRDSMALYLSRVAQALDDAIATTGAHVVFLPTYNTGHVNDLAECENVCRQMASSDYSILCVDDPKLYQSLCGEMSVMLSGRMHAAILASTKSTPIVGIAYNQKFQGTFSLLGYEERCLSIGDFIVRDMHDCLSSMLVDSVRVPENFQPSTESLAATTRAFIRDLFVEESIDESVGAAQERTQ